jgi:glycosyltransferase involved in cell wall biosynthesis
MEWREAMIKLKESNILVIPSRMESIPQVIKEAFFLKIPIIATNVGGIPELIIHKKTGMLIPPNDPKKLKETILELLSNKELSEKISNNGFDFVINNLTWEVLLPKYIKFYEDLMNS